MTQKTPQNIRTKFPTNVLLQFFPIPIPIELLLDVKRERISQSTELDVLGYTAMKHMMKWTYISMETYSEEQTSPSDDVALH